MRRLLFLTLLFGPVAYRFHSQVPDAPRIYASESDKAGVDGIRAALTSYEDGSLNEYYERQTIAVVHHDLDQMDETSPSWPDDMKQLRADMDTLVDLDHLLTKQIVL